MKAKSHLAIRRELRRVLKEQTNAQRSDGYDGSDFRALYGAAQALSWAMGDNAMAPAKAFRAVKGR